MCTMKYMETHAFMVNINCFIEEKLLIVAFGIQLSIIIFELCATYPQVFLFIKVKGRNGMEDKEILELFLERQEQALSELERKYGARLKLLASRMVSEEDAEECVNDTYLAVWNSVPPNRPEYLFAYAAKICRKKNGNCFFEDIGTENP